MRAVDVARAELEQLLTNTLKNSIIEFWHERLLRAQDAPLGTAAYEGPELDRDEQADAQFAPNGIAFNGPAFAPRAEGKE